MDILPGFSSFLTFLSLQLQLQKTFPCYPWQVKSQQVAQVLYNCTNTDSEVSTT